MYIKGKISNGNENKSDIEEVWIACGVKEKENDKQPAIFVTAYCIEEESKPVAVGRVQYDGEEYCIGGIYVKQEAENSGYENFLIKMLLYYAFQQGADIVYAETEKEREQVYLSEGFQEVKETQGQIRFNSALKRLMIEKNKQKLCNCTEL